MPELEKQRVDTGVLGMAWPCSLPDCTPHRALQSVAQMSLPSIEETHPILLYASTESKQ